jgi:hypothetical protein
VHLEAETAKSPAMRTAPGRASAHRSDGDGPRRVPLRSTRVRHPPTSTSGVALLLALIARVWWLLALVVEADVNLLKGLAALGSGVGGESAPIASGHCGIGRLSDAEEATWCQSENPNGVELGAEQDDEGTEIDPGQQAQDDAEHPVAGARTLQLVGDQVGADEQPRRSSTATVGCCSPTRNMA